MVCCCRRATSSQRLSTTISWPLGAGQLWLVSTALLFFFFFFYWQSPALVVVAVLCPGNSEHRLWLCEGRVMGGKGQWVYDWIQHSRQLSDLAFRADSRQQIRQLHDVIYYEFRPWHSSFTSSFPPSMHFYVSVFFRPCSSIFLSSVCWKKETFHTLSSSAGSLSWLVQIARNLTWSCNKLAPHCSRHQSMTDKQRILNVPSFFFPD